MRYWWVNHKQTFRHEVGGGYLWSPKVNRDGRRNVAYDFMTEVMPGDVVFSYAFTQIQAVGFAASSCYSCPRPDEFGTIGLAWNLIGWRVDVKFQKLDNPISPREHIQVIEPLLPRKYAPLHANGNGRQDMYLASISHELANVLLDLLPAPVANAARTERVAEQAAPNEIELRGQTEWEEIEEQRIRTGGDIPETTRHALIVARQGQGLFKERVAEVEHACRITKVDNPSHLIASHIKPWRFSSNDERLEGSNGLLLTPSIDHLFDRGFISFEDGGELLLAPAADRLSLARMGVPVERPNNVGQFNTDQRHFLAFHRKEIFLHGSRL
jgi:putative restriction endonuclease